MKPPATNSSQYPSNVLNNIQGNIGQMNMGSNNFYQNYRTHVKSNSCSSISVNQFLNYKSIAKNNNNNNKSGDSQNQTFKTNY